jgi:outer membrane protein assembly factor BamB
MASSTQPLVIGVGGHAVRLDPTTGSELWRTKVKGSSYVTVSHAPGRVFAGAGGEVFCLDEATGRMLWRSKLKGLGLGVVAFPASGELVAAAAEAAARRAATTAT